MMKIFIKIILFNLFCFTEIKAQDTNIYFSLNLQTYVQIWDIAIVDLDSITNGPVFSPSPQIASFNVICTNGLFYQLQLITTNLGTNQVIIQYSTNLNYPFQAFPADYFKLTMGTNNPIWYNRVERPVLFFRGILQ